MRLVANRLQKGDLLTLFDSLWYIGKLFKYRKLKNIGESSKGKTADSGSAYRGSNPLSPAIKTVIGE